MVPLMPACPSLQSPTSRGSIDFSLHCSLSGAHASSASWVLSQCAVRRHSSRKSDPARPRVRAPKRQGSATHTEVDIHGLGSHGEGIGTWAGGNVIFVAGTIPGERVRARVTRQYPKHSFGQLETLITTSSDRVQPPCPLAAPGQCGGCQVMHMSPVAQLLGKAAKVSTALQRIGGLLRIPPLGECVPSPDTLRYRNKMVFVAFADAEDEIDLGLLKHHSHEPVSVLDCQLQSLGGQQVFAALKRLLREYKFRPNSPDNRYAGDLGAVMIRSASLSSQESLLVTLIGMRASEEVDRKLAAALMCVCPSVQGVVWNISRWASRSTQTSHSQRNTASRPHQLDEQPHVTLGPSSSLLCGVDHLLATVCGLQFKVSPASFLQVNPKQAQQLYQTALAWTLGSDMSSLGLRSLPTVLDAFCGVGTLSLVFARGGAGRVIGVDCVPESIADAKSNAQRNGIDNALFRCDDAPRAVALLPRGAIDICILNPPRQGCDQRLLRQLGASVRPQLLLYISCDPATLARDLQRLHTPPASTDPHDPPTRYELIRIRCFDMFPQTAHVETLCLLRAIHVVNSA